MIEKAGVDAEVAKLLTLFSVWRNQRYANEGEIGRLPAVIESLNRKIESYAKDAERIEPQTMEGIVVELSGRRVVGANAVGDVLRPIMRSAKEDLQTASHAIERIIGRFAGFELGVHASRSSESPNLYLVGKCVYHADPYQTGAGLVAALLAVLESISKHYADAASQSEMKRKRLADCSASRLSERNVC